MVAVQALPVICVLAVSSIFKISWCRFNRPPELFLTMRCNRRVRKGLYGHSVCLEVLTYNSIARLR
jgi:hypothetical protein